MFLYSEYIKSSPSASSWNPAAGGSRIDLLLFLNIPVLFSTIVLLRQHCLDLSQGQDKSVSLDDLEFLKSPPSAGLMFRARCACLPSKRRARPQRGLAYSLFAILVAQMFCSKSCTWMKVSYYVQQFWLIFTWSNNIFISLGSGRITAM